MKTNPNHILLGLAAAVFLLGSCRQEAPQEPVEEKIPIRTRVVSGRMTAQPILTSGKLYSKTESRLSFKTGGIIERICVDEGQKVDEGQLLARLKLDEIRSQVRQAELALQKARRDYNRVSNLYEDSVVTLEQFQDARTGLELARSNYSIARFNLEYSEITAPSDGKILRKIAEENEIVGPGHPVLYFASTAADWVVRVNLTDRDIVRVNPGDSASVMFDAWRDRSFPCRVSEIGNAADPYTGTYEVELLLTRPPERLVSGFIGKVGIFPSDSSYSTILPVETIIEGNGYTATVYVMGPDGVEKREIQIRSITDQGVVVASGLTDGEEVVVDGASFIREGIPVEKINPDEKTGN